jgi:hypothetical protein
LYQRLLSLLLKDVYEPVPCDCPRGVRILAFEEQYGDDTAPP